MAIGISMDPGMPFHGLLSDKMNEVYHRLDTREIMVSWLPAWWFTFSMSLIMAGVSIGCTVWATVNTIADQPVGTPVLLGLASLVGSFAGILVPLGLAYFRDRSESRQLDYLKQRIHDLEAQVIITNATGQRNQENIQKVTDATRRIADAAAQVVGRVTLKEEEIDGSPEKADQ